MQLAYTELIRAAICSARAPERLCRKEQLTR